MSSSCHIRFYPILPTFMYIHPFKRCSGIISEKSRLDRQALMKKLMSICPTCGKLIYGRDIDNSVLEAVMNRSHGHWPMKYEHHHDHHHVNLYIDTNFAVRGCEAPVEKTSQH